MSKATDYFTDKFYFSNVCLNSVEYNIYINIYIYIYNIPQQKIKKQTRGFKFLSVFFCLSPYQNILTKRYSHFTLISQ